MPSPAPMSDETTAMCRSGSPPGSAFSALTNDREVAYEVRSARAAFPTSRRSGTASRRCDRVKTPGAARTAAPPPRPPASAPPARAASAAASGRALQPAARGTMALVRAIVTPTRRRLISVECPAAWPIRRRSWSSGLNPGPPDLKHGHGSHSPHPHRGYHRDPGVGRRRCGAPDGGPGAGGPAAPAPAAPRPGPSSGFATSIRASAS